MPTKTIKPKLLYFVEAMGGGVFTYIVDLANGLSSKYDVYVAYATRPQTPSNYKDYFDPRVKLIEVKNFSRSFSISKNVKAFFEMKRIAKEINPDIIHLHSSMAGVLGRFAFNGQRMPLFYTPHGYSFLMQNFGNSKQKIFKQIEKICAKCNCTTISCSAGENLETQKLTHRALEVDNGINISELEKLIQNVDISHKKNFDVFTLGRITAQKNPAEFNKIALACPNLSFLWIGDGELRNEITAPNVTISGWVDRDSALSYALNSEIFLLTSLWEGLPMSLLEAMYMKKLCVVSDVIGNHDVITNDVNGYVCSSTEDFIKAIKKSKTQENDRLVQSAYDDILNHYNTRVVIQKYDEIYEKALEN